MDQEIDNSQPKVLVLPKISDDLREENPGEDPTEGAQRLLLGLLFELDTDFSWERFAWVIAWNKTYWLLRSSVEACDSQTQLALEVLSRTAFEHYLHVNMITMGSSADRLRAYVAWCIWNDRDLLTELSKETTLDGAYDPEAARVLRAIENEWDPSGEVTPRQLSGERSLEREKFRGRDWVHHEIHAHDNWLSSPALLPWKEELQSKSKKRRNPSFFSLFNRSLASVAKQLESTDSGWMYAIFKQGSGISHFSTMKPFASIQGRFGIMSRLDEKDSCEQSFGVIRSLCESITLDLKVMKSDLW